MGGAGADHLGHISIHALREEGDGYSWNREYGWIQFLSTPSAKRATHTLTVDVSDGKISIHALREEGDGVSHVRGADQINFYPRPPRGGRPTLFAISHRFERISIHALREEGDDDSRGPRTRPTPFLSTPSARRATGKA